ncbi:MAG TPA: EAL domain-containing protein [Candidatus Brocadiaceae bacterium]|nr:EAL domain-containing protein [Candidatus Brocadiaceae bacterium]
MSESRFQELSSAVEQNPCSIIITDLEGNIQYVNEKFCRMTGFTPEEAIGQNPRMFKSGETPTEEYEDLWGTITTGKTWRGELHNKKKNGDLYWGHTSISSIKNVQGIITNYIAVTDDISKRKWLETKLVNLADRDPLTNLFNRRRFQEELKNCLAQSQRYKLNGALLFIDLDNFKYVNDTLGHRTGDTLLKVVSELLKKRLRTTDTLARLGGDEFAIILHRTDQVQALTISKEIVDLIRRFSMVKEGETLGVTASIGIALFPDHGFDSEILLTYADLAMYQAKEEGRNRCCFYTHERKTQIEMLQIWKKRINNALLHDRFALFLQPIRDIRSNQIAGHEVLLRMINEDGEHILPSNFLNFAERLGLMREIDRWVVSKAFTSMKGLHLVDNSQYLEINLSVKSISDPELLSIIKDGLTTSGINPANLVLEISESAIVENIQESKRFITTLKEMGCRFALDDFGIGFSSFNYLKNLLVDMLKIDGSLICDLLNKTEDQHLVKAMVGVARGLRKETIAKFVNNDETIKLLQGYGVDYAQGYFIGEPYIISTFE